MKNLTEQLEHYRETGDTLSLSQVAISALEEIRVLRAALEEIRDAYPNDYAKKVRLIAERALK